MRFGTRPTGGVTVREIALHVLDLMENSVAAGARRVIVRVVQSRARDVLEITVEDDGCGLSADASEVVNPFFTTKPGKRTGLGLSLFREAAERAGGDMRLSSSPLGGTSVRVRMRLRHVDRMPLGDLAATLGAIACTAPDVDIACEVEVDGRREAVSTGQLRAATEKGPGRDLSVMRQLASRVRKGLEGLGALP